MSYSQFFLSDPQDHYMYQVDRTKDIKIQLGNKLP